MRLARRQFLALAAAVGVVPVASLAQSYPTRLIKIVVPFPAGGPADVQARLLARNLSAALSQPVVVDNRPGGASGSVGVRVVTGAAAMDTCFL